MHVAIATDSSAPGLDPDNALLLEDLIERGLDARPVVWDDPGFDWSSAQLCVVRSTWDYVSRREEFLAWADRVTRVTKLHNDAETLRWNSHKSYLRDLDERGVRIVPTEFVARETPLSLSELMADRDWSRVVVKPAVSASGRGAFSVTRDELAVGQRLFDELVSREDLLVQAFMSGVTEYGEVSIVYVNGVYSHAVRLWPGRGDFRVQEQFGGTLERVRPRTAELLLAHHVLEAGPRKPLYARIDILADGMGELRLNEYELIEPRLHLLFHREAAVRLGDAICAILKDDSESVRTVV